MDVSLHTDIVTATHLFLGVITLIRNGFRDGLHEAGVRKNNTGWKEWCPETDKQNMKVGGDEMFCMVAGTKHRDMLIWGRTIINFDEPSWKMRYRFAKLGQAYVDSAPGGREEATCKFWKE